MNKLNMKDNLEMGKNRVMESILGQMENSIKDISWMGLCMVKEPSTHQKDTYSMMEILDLVKNLVMELWVQNKVHIKALSTMIYWMEQGLIYGKMEKHLKESSKILKCMVQG